uniref:PITH domain-containing protein n=1 Tax=Cucumis melo TaxID=3656 RepID=A0A9I9E8R2_CUCME
MACLHDHSCEDHDCSSDWSLYKHIDLPRPFGKKLEEDCANISTILFIFELCERARIVRTSMVSALNEATPGSVKSVFKAWEHRLNSSGDHLESNEGDPELLISVPVSLFCSDGYIAYVWRALFVFWDYSIFTSDVKIKSISIIGGPDGTSPSKMRVSLPAFVLIRKLSFLIRFINREGIDFSDAQSMQAVQEWDLAENLQGVLEYQTRYSKFQGVGNLTLHFPDNYGGDTTQIHYIGLKGEATQLKRDVVATIVYEITPNPSDHK